LSDASSIALEFVCCKKTMPKSTRHAAPIPRQPWFYHPLAGNDTAEAMVTNKLIGTLIAISVIKPPSLSRTRAEGNTSANTLEFGILMND
jgi:hypothetical protein